MLSILVAKQDDMLSVLHTEFFCRCLKLQNVGQQCFQAFDYPFWMAHSTLHVGVSFDSL